MRDPQGEFMSTRGSRGCRYAAFVGVLLCAALAVTSSSYAQAPTTNITSSGLGTTLNGSCGGGGTCNITGGTQKGSNLFHSFGAFNVGAGDFANFCNASTCGVPSGSELSGIQNILGRVDGGSRSSIFGGIRTTEGFGTANLFLMNPAGWIFGSTASLAVGGSFHVTTADYIKLGTDGIFYANPSAGTDVLTVSPPSAFGFLS